MKSGDIDQLFEALVSKGFRIIGPILRDDAILLDELTGLEDLPQGWTDRQDSGTYRVERRKDKAFFEYNMGPHSWKKYLHPPTLTLWRSEKTKDGFRVLPEKEPEAPCAFLGVRACELEAIRIQDRVLLEGPYRDTRYATRRKNTFIVAVNCTKAGGTCFCASMGTGPKAIEGFDLALTELKDKGRHDLLLEAGSDRGKKLLDSLLIKKAADGDIQRAKTLIEKAASEMGRRMDVSGIKELLQENLENPLWNEVAERCLACTSCTMVCPTCFCTTLEDYTSLDGSEAERRRRWDSCFTRDFSYIHGGSIRILNASRYRQWLTHKLANWHDQFDSSGCVGCGRCITWCPAGIDITEEVRALRTRDVRKKETTHGNP